MPDIIAYSMSSVDDSSLENKGREAIIPKL
jgi:hypothetical protein